MPWLRLITPINLTLQRLLCVESINSAPLLASPQTYTKVNIRLPAKQNVPYYFLGLPPSLHVACYYRVPFDCKYLNKLEEVIFSYFIQQKISLRMLGPMNKTAPPMVSSK